MQQGLLSKLAILSIEYAAARKHQVNKINDDFASQKERLTGI